MKLHDRKPDIENLYKVLRGEEPARPTLFELFMNGPIYERLAGRKIPSDGDPAFEWLRISIDAYAAAGFDYAPCAASDFRFSTKGRQHKNTSSLNDGFVITDEASFEAYKWPEPENFDYSRMEKIRPFLPEGMKLKILCPSGVLENTIALVGYDNLCYMIYDNPQLAKAVFDNVGSRILRYQQIAVEYETAGLVMSNDDWGFKTQTFLSVEDMRKYVLPWHKKIVDLAHDKGLPALLHSCGYFGGIMDDVIEIGFDGKHSYEDAILPVEESYEKWHGSIAILGGIDVDFIIKNSEEKITERCRAMLKRAEGRGGYALGTGNSVPEFIPQDNYIALLKAALEY